MDYNHHLVIPKMLITVGFKTYPYKKNSLMICIVTTQDKKHKDILFPVYSKKKKKPETTRLIFEIVLFG